MKHLLSFFLVRILSPSRIGARALLGMFISYCLGVWKQFSYNLMHIFETRCIPQTFIEAPVRCWVLLGTWD